MWDAEIKRFSMIDFPETVMSIIVASHKLPIEWHNGDYRDQPRHKAFYSGIASLKSQDISYVGCISDHSDALIKPTKQLPTNMVHIDVDINMHHDFYHGFCKQILWQILHYQPYSPQVKEKSYYDAYCNVNQLYANEIAKIYKPNDMVFINDYHLFLVPGFLRKMIPNVKVGFFLHSPFPSSELFRSLPQRKELLEGVLGSQLIGFQNYSYARHFLSSCTRVLGLESSPGGIDHDHHVNIGIFQIGINVSLTEKLCNHPLVEEKLTKLKQAYKDKIVIVGRERLEAHKGVLQKLKAFERFLELYPEYHEKVVLIQMTNSGDKKLESKVNDLVMKINGKYGSVSFSPILHIHRMLPYDDYYALLRLADVGLFTPIRDGMNIASHEFIVCQSNNRAPLVLSEFTGTAGSLPGALLVNPWDFAGVAASIYQAIQIPLEERKAKHQVMYDHVIRYNCERWANNFVNEMLITCTSVHNAGLNVEKVNSSELCSAFNKARKRLLLLDYDGTLTRIVNDPQSAIPTTNLLDSLAKLCSRDDVLVYIISGRDQAFLEQHLGHIPHIGLSAEHGSFVKHANTTKWLNLISQIDLGWKTKVTEIFEYYTERTQGSFIEQKRCSVTWHYRLADLEYGAFQANECQNHLENSISGKMPVELLIGKKNLEVRPVSINKGEMVKKILALYPESDFIMCCG
eukprot:NODE_111_length_19413_cov_0.323703.p3 type:complete len:686 gc:universal NODE_111_length_19413_cov_0.323703:10149-8092(-)